MAMLAEFRTERKIGVHGCMCHRNSQRLIETHAIFPCAGQKKIRRFCTLRCAAPETADVRTKEWKTRTPLDGSA